MPQGFELMIAGFGTVLFVGISLSSIKSAWTLRPDYFILLKFLLVRI